MKNKAWRFASGMLAGGILIAGVSAARAESFSRISDILGSVTLREEAADESMPATPNLLLQEGDRLESGYGAAAEIETPGRARIRMGRDSLLRIGPSGGSDRRDEAVLERGAVIVDDLEGTTAIQTDAAAVSPNSGSVVRVEMERGETRVQVSEGSAQIQPVQNGEFAARPMLLRAGEEMILEADSDPEGPAPSRASDDDLDRYRRDRRQALGLLEADGRDKTPLEAPLMGSDELEQNGEWVVVDGRSVWRPYVASGWRPYSAGYWAWYASAGWTWISYEPFGYVTFHYGAWIHDPFYRWCWVPGYVWRPAHVAWITVGPYYAWAPLNPFGSIVIISNTVVINRIDHRVFTVAPKRFFAAGPKGGPPAGGRFIPNGMRGKESIRVADARLFIENPKIGRADNFKAVRPERSEKVRPFETIITPERRPNRPEFPKSAGAITREAGFQKQGRVSEAPVPRSLSGLPARSRPERIVRPPSIPAGPVDQKIARDEGRAVSKRSLSPVRPLAPASKREAGPDRFAVDAPKARVPVGSFKAPAHRDPVLRETISKIRPKPAPDRAPAVMGGATERKAPSQPSPFQRWNAGPIPKNSR